VIYSKECTTISTDFSNAASLSVEGGFLYAELADKTTPKTYEFCLKVSTSESNIFTMVPNLEFVLEANCKNVLSKVNSSIEPIKQMFNDVPELKKLFGLTDLFINSD